MVTLLKFTEQFTVFQDNILQPYYITHLCKYKTTENFIVKEPTNSFQGMDLIVRVTMICLSKIINDKVTAQGLYTHKPHRKKN